MIAARVSTVAMVSTMTLVELHKLRQSHTEQIQKSTASAQESAYLVIANTKIILNHNCHRRGVVSKMVYQVETENCNPYVSSRSASNTTERQRKTNP